MFKAIARWLTNLPFKIYWFFYTRKQPVQQIPYDPYRWINEGVTVRVKNTVSFCPGRLGVVSVYERQQQRVWLKMKCDAGSSSVSHVYFYPWELEFVEKRKPAKVAHFPLTEL